jgi:hypothetical protein
MITKCQRGPSTRVDCLARHKQQRKTHMVTDQMTIGSGGNYITRVIWLLSVLRRLWLKWELHVKSVRKIWKKVNNWETCVQDTEARCSVDGWGTMPQAGRSWVRFPMSLDFFNWLNPSSRALVLLSTHSLTETNTKNLPGDKKRPALKAGNLTAIYGPTV